MPPKLTKEPSHQIMSLFNGWIVKRLEFNEQSEEFIILLRAPKGHFDNNWSDGGGFIQIYHPLVPVKEWTKTYRGCTLEGIYRGERKTLFCKLIHKKKKIEVLFEVVDTWSNKMSYKTVEAIKYSIIARLPN